MKHIDPIKIHRQLSTLHARIMGEEAPEANLRSDLVSSMTRYLHEERSGGHIDGFGVECDTSRCRVIVWFSRSIRWTLEFPIDPYSKYTLQATN